MAIKYIQNGPKIDSKFSSFTKIDCIVLVLKGFLAYSFSLLVNRFPKAIIPTAQKAIESAITIKAVRRAICTIMGVLCRRDDPTIAELIPMKLMIMTSITAGRKMSIPVALIKFKCSSQKYNSESPMRETVFKNLYFPTEKYIIACTTCRAIAIITALEIWKSSQHVLG